MGVRGEGMGMGKGFETREKKDGRWRGQWAGFEDDGEVDGKDRVVAQMPRIETFALEIMELTRRLNEGVYRNII
jgi:hypothetical protein